MVSTGWRSKRKANHSDILQNNFLPWIRGRLWARSYMFSVHVPGKMCSKQVLGTRSFTLQALWNVLGTPSFRFQICTHLVLRCMTYCVYTAQRVEAFWIIDGRLMRSFWCGLFMLIAVCVLSPAQLEHVLGFTSFRIRFGWVLREQFVLRTWFNCVLTRTVLPGTQLFSTREHNVNARCFRSRVAESVMVMETEQSCAHIVNLAFWVGRGQ